MQQRRDDDVTEIKLVKLWDRFAYSACLPFTWPNGWSKVWGNGTKNSALVNEFRPGIAFTICTNHFHLPKNDREGLKLVSKMALMKWKKKRTNIRTTFSDVPLLPEIFCWNDPKSFVPFTFQPNFPETHCKWSEQSQKEQDQKCPPAKNQCWCKLLRRYDCIRSVMLRWRHINPSK